MPFEPFALENFLSDFEQTVEYNYSESGVHPVTFGELLELAGLDVRELLDVSLNYPEVNGELQLRKRIASMYPGAGPENVLVTVGASEANLLAATTLLEPGDEAVVTCPTYLQFAGLSRNMGVTVRTVPLVEEDDWALDTDALQDALGPRTKVVSVVNPSNPTGHVLSESETDAIFEAAESVNAWLLSDEVYAGTEHEEVPETPTLFGRYDKTIVVNSLSKAYGLPGLRCGWMVGPENIIGQLWRRHEYAVVSASMLANKLAAVALSENVRGRLISRTRRLIKDGFDVLRDHLNVHKDVFSVVPPRASALSFVRYNLPIGSTEFVERLIQTKSVLVVPGDCFGLDHHLRITSALPIPYLKTGFERLNELVSELRV